MVIQKFFHQFLFYHILWFTSEAISGGKSTSMLLGFSRHPPPTIKRETSLLSLKLVNEAVEKNHCNDLDECLQSKTRNFYTLASSVVPRRTKKCRRRRQTTSTSQQS
uniref:Secreted protein n=1 Tax=Ascaris lumbricoides TaxID=6252 RepID=A0A0M3HIE4_ASCLU